MSTPHVPQTNRLLMDIGSRVGSLLSSSGFDVCKVLVTHTGAGELECCDCDEGDDSYVVAIWEERSYPSQLPPLPVEPEPGSSAWVDVHELHLTIATCWPQFDRVVPREGDPRQTTALRLLSVRDTLANWLSSCARNMEQMLPEGRLNVWLRGIRAERAGQVGMECRGWELTMLVW